MGRVIPVRRIEQIAALRKEDPEALGPMLGELAINGRVPVDCLAMLLQVSEPTIYRWMYGESKPSRVFHPDIKKVLTILRKAKRSKQLPLEGTQAERVKLFIALVKEYKQQISRAE